MCSAAKTVRNLSANASGSTIFNLQFSAIAIFSNVLNEKTMHKSRVLGQNGISRQYNMLEIYYSGLEPSKFSWKDGVCDLQYQPYLPTMCFFLFALTLVVQKMQQYRFYLEDSICDMLVENIYPM